MVVYSINKDGSLYATGDILYHIQRDSHKIGKYNSKSNNQFKSKTFSYKEIKKVLGL